MQGGNQLGCRRQKNGHARFRRPPCQRLTISSADGASETSSSAPLSRFSFRLQRVPLHSITCVGVFTVGSSISSIRLSARSLAARRARFVHARSGRRFTHIHFQKLFIGDHQLVHLEKISGRDGGGRRRRDRHGIRRTRTVDFGDPDARRPIRRADAFSVPFPARGPW